LKSREFTSKFSKDFIHLLTRFGPRSPKVQYVNSVLFRNEIVELSVRSDLGQIGHIIDLLKDKSGE
jgi:hypothetical protein